MYAYMNEWMNEWMNEKLIKQNLTGTHVDVCSLVSRAFFYFWYLLFYVIILISLFFKL